MQTSLCVAPYLEAGEGVSAAGCLGTRWLILSAEESSMEDRSVQKTSLFTNMVPKSASGTLIPPECLGSYNHVEQSHFRLCSSTCWGEDTTWKAGTPPSGGQAPARDPLLPGCFPGCCWQVWGSCFVAGSRWVVFQRFRQQAPAASLTLLFTVPRARYPASCPRFLASPPFLLLQLGHCTVAWLHVCV